MTNVKSASSIRRTLLVLSLGILGGGCAREKALSVSQPEVVTLQLKWKHQFEFAGFYAAQEKGFYRQAGLDVRIVEAPDVGDPAESVVTGAAQYGVASSDLIPMRSAGLPVVALAAIFQHSPLILVAARKSGVASVHDLVGKRVMVEPQSAELFAYLQYEGIPAGRFHQVPHTHDPNALIAGQVDAMSAYSADEPFLLEQAGLETVILDPRSGGIDFYGDTLFTTETEIRDHPERMKAVLEASLRGWEYALKNPDEIIEVILARYSQRHSRAHLQYEARALQRLILPDIVEVGYMNPGRWRYIADTYAEMRIVPKGLSLTGFIYERNPSPSLTWVYLSFAGVMLLLGGVTFIAARFYQMNRTIRRDILERKRMESGLRALEKRYRTLAENAPFAVIISYVSDGAVAYLNPIAAQKLEISRDYAIGKPVESFYEDPDDRKELLALLKVHGFVQSFERRLKNASGAGFWATISASIIDFEERPAVMASLVDTTERRELHKRLLAMALTDELTGLYNRRHMLARGAEEVERARRHSTAFSVLLLDIDHFKVINDENGHDGGDVVLRELAGELTRCARAVDVAGRWGGEEFVVLLPNTALDEAVVMAERLRRTIGEKEIRTASRALRVTVSIGVAAHGHEMVEFDDLLKRADALLYEAKNRGRNCVVSASQQPLAISDP